MIEGYAHNVFIDDEVNFFSKYLKEYYKMK